jgi:pimeloyl-ACP methyl ester carboxylesterase
MKQLQVYDIALSYLEQGQNATVVMVHGATADHRIWEMQREAIARDFRYIALDQRYFGANPWSDQGARYSLGTHAEDLAAFIRALDVGPVHLVGWSYGGGVALNLGVKHPELVRSLFLYEPTAIAALVTNPKDQDILAEEHQGVSPAIDAFKANDVEGAIKRLAEWTNNLPAGEFDSATPDWVKTITFENARIFPLIFTAPPPPPITAAQLGRIKFPVAVAKGAQTRPFLNILADTVSRCIPGSQKIVIPDSTHAAPYQNPTGFNEALLGFLAKQ